MSTLASMTDPATLVAKCHDECCDECERLLESHRTRTAAPGAPAGTVPVEGLADLLVGPMIKKILATILPQLATALKAMIDQLVNNLMNANPKDGGGGGIPSI